MDRNLFKPLALTIILRFTFAAQALVLHPNGEPDLATWTDRPDSDVLGRWSTNGSCVAVSSNCIVTTRHQAGGAGTSVYFNQKPYVVEEVWNEPLEGGQADLRLCRIAAADGGTTNLAEFARLYTNRDEFRSDVVIGGYGKGRGTLLENGYEWDNSGNTTARWGQNRVQNTATGDDDEGLSSDVIIADFDASGAVGPGGATAYEAIIAEFDSGGGWFIKEGGIWKLAGLCRQVSGHAEGQSWYSPPDMLDAVRISSYAAWIEQTIPARLPGDINLDDRIDFIDYALFASEWQRNDCEAGNSNCKGADFAPADGTVDQHDLASLAENWLGGY